MAGDGELKEKATQDIERIFSDTSISQEDTIIVLEELRDDIDMKIEAIKSDLKHGH